MHQPPTADRAGEEDAEKPGRAQRVKHIPGKMLDAFLSVADRAGARCNHLLRKCANLCADRQDFGRARQIVIKLRLLALGPALFDGSNRREFSCPCHQPLLTSMEPLTW